jgi:hypothetical protein
VLDVATVGVYIVGVEDMGEYTRPTRHARTRDGVIEFLAFPKLSGRTLLKVRPVGAG